MNQIQKVTSEPKKDPVEVMLSKGKAAIEAVLPSVVSSDRFVRVALTEIRKNPLLQQCDPLSICSCVMQGAQLGLEFGSILGQMYLIPYGKECTLQIGYKGYIAKLMQEKIVKSIRLRAVYEGDEFQYDFGTDERLVHKPTGQQKNMTHVYAIAVLPDGATMFDVMDREAVEKIRDRFSRGKDKGPWKDSFEEMAKKTVLKRLIKVLPITSNIGEVLEHDSTPIEEIEDKRDPQKLIEVRESQMQLTQPESEAIQTELEKLFIRCDELEIDTEDLPHGQYTDQQAVAACQIMKERIGTWTSKNASN